ncbi:hypothetical protein ABZ499_27690 [Streptomyces sp. NPDC019990]|uniref:hypothetical protein n=1 Tax=Streptomyces sp. NPDC019990 TaxID=3154693 RepID=UPI0033E89E37
MPYSSNARPDQYHQELGELLGGDQFAYRIARLLHRDGITSTAALRKAYERPVPPGHRKGSDLLLIRGVGDTALDRVAAAFDESSAPST